MLRLQKCILTQLLPSTSISPLHRLISAAAPAVSPNPSFAVEEYLVATCGLTRPQAAKAFPKLAHLKSPAKPDAVLAFLAGLGLSGADVAALVAKDPKFLCAKVESTLSPVADGLAGLGLSPPEITRLVSLGPSKFRCRSIVSKLQYCLHLLGSFDNLLRVLKVNSCLLCADLETVVKPNTAFLRECGLGVCDIAKLYISVPWMLTTTMERMQGMVARAEGLGAPRGSPMFRHVLDAIAFISQDKITAKVEYLKKAFRWSDAEVSIAVSKAPTLLARSEESLQCRSEFLISEVGLEPGYIAHRPIIINYSMDGRLRPRYYVFKFLTENGWLDRDRDYYRTVMITEKVFVEKFICPHKEAAPHLAQDYATACRGEVPTRFISA